jgi:alkaline phosphatase D
MLDLTRLHEAVRHEGGVSRRLFLSYAATLAALPALQDRAIGAIRNPSFSADPFSLGVASGDPDHTGFVLWTRLAPQPLEPYGGMEANPVEMKWEVAEDDGFRRVAKRGTVTAAPQLAHSVHVEVEGLKPDRWYWYRFRSGDATSPIGRTRTLPKPDAMPKQLRFAFASCQHWEAGLYTAYEAMAKEELDLVFFLGDYIYEGPGRDGGVRKHAGPKLTTLGDYRVRYSQYRTDPLLQGMHARCPWFLTTDDHEVENNYAGAQSQTVDMDPVVFLALRANAYQAYYEMMPLRRQCLPQGPDMRLYRKASYGRLAELLVLDTRQYRTDQPNGDKASELNEAALKNTNTLLGAAQRGWLQGSLIDSPAVWNVLAQQVMMGMVGFVSGDTRRYSMDQWPSAAYERMALMKWIGERRIPNPVVLTGDIHSNWVNDLRVDDRKPEMPVVATEFVGTSISSGGNGFPIAPGLATLMANNPCIKYHGRQPGYVKCTLTPTSYRSDYVIVEDITKPGGKVVNTAAFTVEAGKPGAIKV